MIKPRSCCLDCDEQLWASRKKKGSATNNLESTLRLLGSEVTRTDDFCVGAQRGANQ